MAVGTLSSDYTGRLKDISILNTPDATLTDAQTVSPSFGRRAKFCSGVQKLLQRYAILLMTNVGSQENFPTFGTNFMYSLRTGVSPTDKITAARIFNLANYEVIKSFRAYQYDTDNISPDELLVDAKLTGISLYGGYAGFDVQITTGSGDIVDFVIPLPK